MKTGLLLLSVVGLALVCAELHGEDQYTEDANVVVVDDSAAMDYSVDEMDDLKDEMEDSRRAGGCPSGFTYYKAQFDSAEPLNTGQRAQIKYFESDSTGAPAGGYSPKTVTGFVDAKITYDGKLKVQWSLNGLSCGDDPRPCTNGVHIHYGNSCDNEASVAENAGTASKGHYYNPGIKDTLSELDDPWADVKWKFDEGKVAGSVEFTEDQLGAPVSSAFDRVVIVHNQDGGKIGCGVLKSNYGGRSTAPHAAEGKFQMRICNNGEFAQYKTQLEVKGYENQAFKYHLHSKYDPVSTELGSTSGHYDSEFKCGPASSFYGNSNCQVEYNCAENKKENCERGDLSGKMGPLEVDNGVVDVVDGRRRRRRRNKKGSSKWSPKDTNPPRIEEFSWLGGTTGATYSSIIVHDDSGRLFGARLIKACASTDYEGKFEGVEGDAANNKVSGTFSMRICSDGSRAEYVGHLKGVKDTEPLSYHAHTKYDPASFSNSGGHYDPTYKCGSASAQGSSTKECDTAPVYPTDGYELGDLSGRNGQVACTDGECNFRVIDLDPPHNVDYLDTSGIDYVDQTGAGNQFTSVVFHSAVVAGTSKYSAVRLKVVSTKYHLGSK